MVAPSTTQINVHRVHPHGSTVCQIDDKSAIFSERNVKHHEVAAVKGKERFYITINKHETDSCFFSIQTAFN